MARLLGRDSDFANLVRIRKPRMDGDRFAIVDYDLLKRLKGKSRQLNNIYDSKELATGVSRLRACGIV
jgi:hypothetical protein